MLLPLQVLRQAEAGRRQRAAPLGLSSFSCSLALRLLLRHQGLGAGNFLFGYVGCMVFPPVSPCPPSKLASFHALTPS